MRKLFRYLLLAAGIATLGGCWKNENTGSELDPSLKFSPVVHILTRASSDYTTYPDDVPFGILAATLPRGTSWSGNSSSATTQYDNSKVTQDSDGEWVPSDPDKIGTKKNLNLLAYAPYSASATIDWDKGVQFKDYDIESGDTLLMYAEPIYDYSLTKNSEDVDIKFTKALAKVDFFAYSTSGDQVAYIRRIIVKGLRTQGSFTQLPVATWEMSGSATSYEHYRNSVGKRLDGSLVQVGDTKTVIPQKFTAEITVDCDFYENGEKVSSVTMTKETDMNWGVCKRCVYILNVSSSGFEIFLNSELL